MSVDRKNKRRQFALNVTMFFFWKSINAAAVKKARLLASTVRERERESELVWNVRGNYGADLVIIIHNKPGGRKITNS